MDSPSVRKAPIPDLTKNHFKKHLSKILLFEYKLVFPYTRTIDITKEIKAYSYYGEIVFKGYDTTKVSEYSKFYQRVLKDPKTGKSYPDTNYVDSVWVLSGVHLFRLDTKEDLLAKVYRMHSWINYLVRPDTLPSKFTSHGYWPKIGDTCLVILDSDGFVSVFALASQEKYIFWDPYVNSSWNSYFVFDSPFEYYPNKPTDRLLKISISIAELYKRPFAGQYHCAIRRKEFWDLFKKTN